MRSVVVILFISASVFLFTRCLNNSAKPAVIANDAGEVFAGSASCASCHKTICDNQLHTAHYLTSQPSSEKNIKGSFEDGKNSFAYNIERNVTMEKRSDGFYQVELVNGEEKKAVRFDITIGSATKGQTYLYWSANRLFELPITYFTASNTWTNSPGYPNRVIFNRPITSRCLECHSTYVKKTSPADKTHEEFDHDQVIYGVDCEKCHGPAAKHVAFQSQHTTDKTARYIINPARLSRQQNLDLCALCHGGRLQKSKPSFSFAAGDTLSNYFTADTSTKEAANIDVHGNQYGLLRASKCFRMSEMTCSTCHSNHENEAGKTALFSQKCMSCHNTEHKSFCKLASLPAATLQKNCIDCHMPVKNSKAIQVLFQGASTPTPATMRSHYIAVYR